MREQVEAINAKVQARLEMESDFLASMRQALAHEAAFANLDSKDCATP